MRTSSVCHVHSGAICSRGHLMSDLIPRMAAHAPVLACALHPKMEAQAKIGSSLLVGLGIRGAWGPKGAPRLQEQNLFPLVLGGPCSYQRALGMLWMPGCSWFPLQAVLSVVPPQHPTPLSLPLASLAGRVRLVTRLIRLTRQGLAAACVSAWCLFTCF